MLLPILFLGSVAAALPGADYTLASSCTKENVKSKLSSIPALLNVSFTSISAQPEYNYTSQTGVFTTPTGSHDFCNISLSYSHAGLNDTVALGLFMPDRATYNHRWLSTGGGGFSINSGSSGALAALDYGAAGGYTDGGFGGKINAVQPLKNGTSNHEAIKMFGYEAIRELTIIGKTFTRSFYNDKSVFSYYVGCSEGGRDGMSQVQRPLFNDEPILSGAVIGAPAFRQGQQQANHLFPVVAQQTENYYPPPCELEKISNLTVESCDELDGRQDGVVSRTDLCKLTFNVSSTIGKPYYCAATSGASGPPAGPMRKRQMMFSPEPEQNGTISAEAAHLAQTLLDGLHVGGKRAYIYYQPSASFGDATTAYNSTSKTWGQSITSLGGEWITRFIELIGADNLSSIKGVTYSTLKDWMVHGWKAYNTTLQTTNPDLSEYKNAGSKIIHIHGETDNSIPSSSSTHYYESVRKIMSPGLSYNASIEALQEFYRLYLVPGAVHCSIGSTQPGPWPTTAFNQLIDWVEKSEAPNTLEAPGPDGNWSLCKSPLRPLWSSSGKLSCVYDQKSIDLWHYDFDAYDEPLY